MRATKAESQIGDSAKRDAQCQLDGSVPVLRFSADLVRYALEYSDL